MRRIAVTLVLGFLVFALPQHAAIHAQVHSQTVSPTSVNELRDWDATVNQMLRTNELQVRLEREDTLVPGRTIQQLDQYFSGVRIWNSGISRQLAGTVAVSIFGVLYGEANIDTMPRLDEGSAKTVIESIVGAPFGPEHQPELIILVDDDAFRLVWIGEIATANDSIRLFIDAKDGHEVRRESLIETQLPTSAYVGHGRGVLGDDKKISTAALNGGFVAYDSIRPPEISTVDLRASMSRQFLIRNGFPITTADLASTTSNNDWTDPEVVDAHVNSSYTYDYYFKKFLRRGLDNANKRIWNLTHQVRRSDIFAASDLDPWFNAFYDRLADVMVYGEGCDCTTTYFGVGRQRVNYLSGALDVVAHELTHGVTKFSSGLIYQSESGALNESFSDIMGTNVEFYFQEPGNGPLKADYLIGEDVLTAVDSTGLNGLRSLENPGLYGQPDHYSKRYVGPPDAAHDNGGVHINSGISNQAYFLAIEGGTNRTSGIRVTGVGPMNRDQIERVFYRGFVQLMPPTATFGLARIVTLQAAQDLYGLNSPPYNAVRDAWTAVGVN